MGHVHLGVLPKTRKWAAVVDALTRGETTATVAALSAQAAERALVEATRDQTFIEAVRLLFLIPRAARSADFADALRRIDLPIRDQPDLLGLLAGLTQRLDAVALTSPHRTDLGQIAGRCLSAVLTDHVGTRLPGLLVPTADDLQSAVRELSTRSGIAAASRDFFGRLVAHGMSSWLARALSTQVGPNRRFATAGERAAFDHALGQFASEATRIIQEFAPGWCGRRLYEEGTITSLAAAEFGAVAVKKIISELQLKRDPDD